MLPGNLKHVVMTKPFCILITLIVSFTIYGQAKTGEKQRDSAFYNTTSKWFSAWKLVSKDIYKIDRIRPVELVFFDDKYVYSTSDVTIKNGRPVKGCNLFNLNLKWKKALHYDTLTLPDKSVVPISLMSFAAPIPGDSNNAFFVMPLLSFWKKSGVTSKELGLENLITGVFIHEFSHSQQMQNFGKRITDFEQHYHFGVPFSDDIVQDIFEKDSNYITVYSKEVELFYSVIKNNQVNKKVLNESLTIMKERQQEYFKGDLTNLVEIDNFFLTMEGLGQYSMYLWLINPKGGNIKKEIAIAGVRRGKKRWSQDEGFALFLILDQLTKSKDWAREMFGNKTESVIQLINEL